MSQCQCQGMESLFDRELAESQLRRVHRRGPQRTTSILLEALQDRDVRGRTLLDIGGGVGIIPHRLLAAGAARATAVDASSAYLSVARAVNVGYYLIQKHRLVADRVSVVGYSEYRPILPNDTPEHRAVNRRVDIVIVTGVGHGGGPAGGTASAGTAMK